jgi:hypothetical protein
MSRDDGTRQAADDGVFDAAVDRAVREMLDVEPGAGLRGRVLARIDVPSGADHVASAFRRRFLLTGVPLAAAATVVLALLLPSRTAERPAPPPAVANVEPQQPSSPRPAPSVVVAQRGPKTTAAPRVVAAARPVATPAPPRMLSAATLPLADSTDIEALESITPIQMEPIAEHRIAPAEISVPPLNPIVELQIAPLTPSERRN